MQAQNSCSNAITIIPLTGSHLSSYTSSSDEFWFKFTTDTTEVGLIISQNSSTSGRIASITLYSGSCSSLTHLGERTFVNQDSLIYIANNLINGQLYFFKITRYLTAPCSTCPFSFSSQLKIKKIDNTPASPEEILAICNENLVDNWQFDDNSSGVASPGTVISGAFTSDYPCNTGFSGPGSISIWPDASGNSDWTGWGLLGGFMNYNMLICDGFDIASDPPKSIWKSIPIDVASNTIYYFSIHLLNLDKINNYRIPPDVKFKINTQDQQFANQGFVTTYTVPQNENWMEVNGFWSSGASILASLEIYMSNFTSDGGDLGIDDIDFHVYVPAISFTLGPDITICATPPNSSPVTLEVFGGLSGITGGTPPYTLHWSTNVIAETITVIPSITTTYTLTVFDANDCHFSDQITVFVTAKPIPAIIDGPRDLCGGSTTTTYTLQNTAGMDVTVQISSSLASINNTGSNILTGNGITSFIVNWNGIQPFPALPNNYETIYVTITDEHKCTSTSELRVVECCKMLQPTDNWKFLFDPKIYSTPPTYGSSNIWEIHGTMDIYANANVTFDNARVYMSPTARIVVHPGGSLHITNGSHFTLGFHCQYMWDGIYTDEKNANIKSVVIDNGSIIEDAINAIVSTHNGNFQVDGAIFRNNYIGIKVSDYYNGLPGFIANTPYDCIINNTTFECNNTSNTINNYPYHGYKPFTGILIENVNDIEIGALNSFPNNTFINMLDGIYAKNSLIKVYGNQFVNINALSTYQAGEAIHAYFVPNPAKPINFLPGLYAGLPSTNLNSLNLFKNCYRGIKNYNQPAEIQSNTFYECANAICCMDAESKTNISFNTISSSAQVPILGKGIAVMGTHTNSKGIDLIISENIITQIAEGIYLISQQGMIDAYPKIGPLNIIKWDNNSTLTNNRTGINLQNCGFSQVFDNEISQSNYPPLVVSDVPLLRGIRVAQSENVLIENNYMTRLGSGIYTNGNLTNTKFNCNVLDNCYHGFYFSVQTSLAPQGSHVGNNSFIGTYDIVAHQEKMSQFIDGPTASIINPVVQWVYNTGNPGYELDENINDPTSIPIHPCYNFIKGVPLTTEVVSCQNGSSSSLFGHITDTTTREDRLGMILRDENYFNALEAQYKWYDKKYLLHLIMNDSNLINLGGYNDYRYQQIFDSLTTGSTGTVERIIKSITDRDYKEAAIQNAMLSGNEIWLKNIKMANEVYLNTWAIGNFELDESEQNVLWPIALSTPYEGGPGVYTARVMLDIDPEDYLIPYDAPTESDKSCLFNFEIWPNPASNSLFIKMESILDPASVLELNNLNGSLAYSIPLNTNSNEVSISLTTVKSGIYFCRIKDALHISKTRKLVIIK